METQAQGAATKSCTKCKEERPLSGFYLRKGRPYQPCQECRKARERRRYQALIAELNELRALVAPNDEDPAPG